MSYIIYILYIIYYISKLQLNILIKIIYVYILTTYLQIFNIQIYSTKTRSSSLLLNFFNYF